MTFSDRNGLSSPRRGLRWIRPVHFGLALTLLIVACEPDAAEVMSWELDDGRPLAAVLPAVDSAVILVYNPGDCLACGSPVAEWFAWAQRGWSRGIALVLTKTPTQVEARQIAALRVQTAGTLDAERGRIETPRIYVVAGGTLVDSAIGNSEVARLTVERNRTDSIFVRRPALDVSRP